MEKKKKRKKTCEKVVMKSSDNIIFNKVIIHIESMNLVNNSAMDFSMRPYHNSVMLTEYSLEYLENWFGNNFHHLIKFNNLILLSYNIINRYVNVLIRISSTNHKYKIKRYRKNSL